MDLSKILEKSGYQTFDFLDGQRKGSNSGKKYELSKLEEYDIEGKTCLDVGCNAGYFLFRLLAKNPKSLFGIDLGGNWIEVANELNKEYFKSDRVEFVSGDFFSFHFPQKFDLILCISTFHYLVNQQQELVDKCFDLLNDQGILLLEIEEYPVNNVAEVNHDPRPYDPAKLELDYPNNLKIHEYMQGKFVILDRYSSVEQGGSVYDRYFYKLRRMG